jgi:hypothetical protein
VPGAATYERLRKSSLKMFLSKQNQIHPQMKHCHQNLTPDSKQTSV